MGVPQRREVNAPQKILHVSGTYFPNGGAAIDNTANKGRGFTVAQGAAGIMTVTLDQHAHDVIAFGAFLGANALADVKVEAGAVAVTAGVVTMVLKTAKTSDGTTAVDIAANANNKITFWMDLQVEGVMA